MSTAYCSIVLRQPRSITTKPISHKNALHFAAQRPAGPATIASLIPEVDRRALGLVRRAVRRHAVGGAIPADPCTRGVPARAKCQMTAKSTPGVRNNRSPILHHYTPPFCTCPTGRSMAGDVPVPWNRLWMFLTANVGLWQVGQGFLSWLSQQPPPPRAPGGARAHHVAARRGVAPAADAGGHRVAHPLLPRERRPAHVRPPVGGEEARMRRGGAAHRCGAARVADGADQMERILQQLDGA